jgi:hypothetical protein
LIQVVFSEKCAKEEEDSVQKFLSKLILGCIGCLGLGLAAG